MFQFMGMSIRKFLISFGLLFLVLFPLTASAAVSFIGQCVGTTSCTPPAHQIGDFFVGFSFRDGNNTAPTIPSGIGWVNISNSAGTNSNGSSFAYKVATTTSETTGTWTSATSFILHIYRGTATTPGNSSEAEGASTTVSYPALTLFTGNGTAWVAGFCGHRSADTTLANNNPPTGMIERSPVADATDEAVGHDTNGGVSSWILRTVSVGGTSSGWRCRMVEVNELSTASGPLDPFGRSGFFGL